MAVKESINAFFQKMFAVVLSEIPVKIEKTWKEMHTSCYTLKKKIKYLCKHFLTLFQKMSYENISLHCFCFLGYCMVSFWILFGSYSVS